MIYNIPPPPIRPIEKQEGDRGDNEAGEIL